MPWVRLDDQWDEHPKFLNVTDLAKLAWVKGLTWSARRLTDGRLPVVAVSKLLSTSRRSRVAARQLVGAGLWTEVDGGYLIHDFLDYQPSSERIKAKREATKERVRRFRNGVTVDACNAVTEAPVTRSVTTVHDPSPDPGSRVVGDSERAILAELSSHPSLQEVATEPFALVLSKRFATFEISKGFKLDWVVAAIGEAAADLAGQPGISAREKAKTVRTYTDNARPPRREKTNGAGRYSPSEPAVESPEPTPAYSERVRGLAKTKRERTERK